jgi:hypothetical protein
VKLNTPPATAKVKKIDPYTHSPTRLRGVVLNYLSTGTTELEKFERKSRSQLTFDLHPRRQDLIRAEQRWKDKTSSVSQEQALLI